MPDRDRKPVRSKPPISRHPLFPAVVALWFGALFGLGSMAIRPGLIEDMVLATGIDTLVPAAAPPLGTTMRLMLALAMAGFGGVLGGLLARRIARPAPETRTRRRSTGNVQQHQEPRAYASYVAAEPARDDNDDQVEPLAPKRRSLAIEVAVTPPEMREHAPLPGGPLILNVADIDSGSDDAELQHSRWADPAAAAPGRTLREPAPVAGPEPEPVPVPEVDIRTQSYARIANLTQPASALLGEAQTAEDAAEGPTRAPDAFTFTQPAPVPPLGAHPAEARLAVAETNQRRFVAPPPAAPASPFAQATVPGRMAEPEPIAAAEASIPFVPEIMPEIPAPTPSTPAPASSFSPRSGSAAERLTSAELGELSPVELIERLAISLQRRRNAAAQANPAPEPAPDIPAARPLPFEQPVPEARPAPVHAANPAAPRSLPASMRHLSFADEDEDEDEDGNEGFALDVPRRHFAMPLAQGQIGSAAAPANVFAVAEPAETNSIDCSAGTAGDSDLLDDGYSSLLELSRRSLDRTTANKQPFIRIEEAEDGDGEEFEPVVVFPGQAARLQQAEAAPPAAPQSIGSPFAPPAASSEDSTGAEALPTRRFDNPAFQAAPGQPRAQAPEEAERALRSALATLQRMSGAA